MLKQVRKNLWELDNGVTIWLDDFGHFQIKSKDDFEITNTFFKACKIARSKRFSK